MNKIAKFALWGAVGFGIGGVISGSLLIAFSGVSAWIGIGGLLITGALGGTSLGMALYSRTRKRILLLSLAGAIGFALGWIAALYVSWDLELYQASYPIYGAILGASLGTALWSWRKVGFLALAGVIGFTILWLIQWGLREWIPIESYAAGNIVNSIIRSLIPGASLGAALGYLEMKRPTD